VFVVLDVVTRRIVHWNVTDHPTAAWTIQQCRAVITGETVHRFLIHDRDAIIVITGHECRRSLYCGRGGWHRVRRSVRRHHAVVPRRA
jgi:hypothetical protein